MICDLHIHSRYSRATSGECTPEHLDRWARRKGIGLLGTGDFTHPAWRAQLREMLEPAGGGLYRLKSAYRLDAATAGNPEMPYFVVSGEISSIYKKNGKTRKVHNLILLPSLEAAEQLSARLEAIGNIHSDGRPILGLDSRDLLEITLEACPEAVFIPAHIWTPHFSMFGAFSGFDTVEECFEDMTPYIHAVETGLSSDPSMNWRLSALDRFTLVSNSDAHSPAKLGREANLMAIAPDYDELRRALSERNASAFQGTVEFFPEEGKYHLDGHRSCGLRLTPEETRQYQGRCPQCGKKITVGVLNRVEQLADRPKGYVPENAPGFERLVPLAEIIGASIGCSSASVKAVRQYDALLEKLGPEFTILRELDLDILERTAGPCIAEGIRRVRAGELRLMAGYDGEYGTIEILSQEEIRQLSGQMTFLAAIPEKKAAKAKKKAETETAKPEIKEKDTSAPQSGLNPEQALAADAEGVAAVLAGPGTGKTQTLVTRIVQMVDKGICPSDITAVTFTHKAAGEMRQRLEKKLGSEKVKAMTIGTFHAICLAQLRRKKGKILLADEAASLSVAAAVAEERGEAYSPSAIVQAASRRKNDMDIDFPECVLDDYQRRMKEYGLMDFDDLLLEGMSLAGQSAMKHILVDEFQDMNPVQYRLLRLWSERAKSLFVIGDPDQAIYGFRGSDPHIFERFFEDYPQAQRIRLKENYRSTPQVLECALAVIAEHHDNKQERRLMPHRGEGAPVNSLRAGDELAQGIYIAKQINRMTGGLDMLDAQDSAAERGEAARSFSDIAVLYRTHRQAQMLERCLRQEGIPYVVAGRDGIAEEKSVQGATAFFRNLLFPEDRSAIVTCLRQSLGVKKKIAEDYAAGRLGDEAKEPGIGRWHQLREMYRPRIQTEKPQQLIQSWMQDVQSDVALEQLANMAVFFERMEDFLENLALGSESDIRRSAAASYQNDAVTLMTLHGSKGLEFPVVFLCGANEGLMPMDMPGRKGDPEEERRLFYVGMTRARDELIITGWGSPSPYLKALPRKWTVTGRTAPKQILGRQLSFL